MLGVGGLSFSIGSFGCGGGGAVGTAFGSYNRDNFGIFIPFVLAPILGVFGDRSGW